MREEEDETVTTAVDGKDDEVKLVEESETARGSDVIGEKTVEEEDEWSEERLELMLGLTERKDRGLNTRRFGRINLGAKFLQSVSDDR